MTVSGEDNITRLLTSKVADCRWLRGTQPSFTAKKGTMGSISEWLLTHNSLVIMPRIPWFYVQSFEAQTRVWSLFGTQTWAEPLFAPVLNVLFVWWKHSPSPSPDISSSLGPAAGSTDANGSNEEQVPISVSTEASRRIKSQLLFQTSGDAQLAESSTGHAARTHG